MIKTNKQNEKEKGINMMKKIIVMMICAVSMISVFGMTAEAKTYLEKEETIIEKKTEGGQYFQNIEGMLNMVISEFTQFLKNSDITVSADAMNKDIPLFERVEDSMDIVVTNLETFVVESDVLHSKEEKTLTGLKNVQEGIQTVASVFENIIEDMKIK